MSSPHSAVRSSTVLTDFDGTIINIDTGAYALEQFASGDWRSIDEQMFKGEITFEECLRRQFRMIDTPIDVIVKRLDLVTSLRPHFIELVNHCMKKRIKLVIVSGGLDFYIRHILHRNGLNVEIRAPTCNLTKKGLDLVFPPRVDRSAFSFKDDLVRKYRRFGSTVFYVGDGYSDYYALKEANVGFAMAGSTLAKMCRSKKIVFQEVSDFLPVIQELDRIES